MEKAAKRREKILEILKEQKLATSATALAKELKVSRQIIVGDVAILRAEGRNIVATHRGYIMKEKTKEYNCIRQIACRHDEKDMKDELYTIVDFGATVLDVVVEHPIYGQLIGNLQIASRYDTDLFISNMQKYEGLPLSTLSGGVHLHTIGCQSEDVFKLVCKALMDKNILVKT